MSNENQNPIYSSRWNGAQRRIGITGGIASGKSSVGAFLKENKGIPLLDADIYAHEALEPNQIATTAVIKRYGQKVTDQIQDQPPALNRSLLGKIIFSSCKERLWLEELIHPIVEKRFQKELANKKNLSKVALIIPLLFEAELTSLCSEIWVVKCNLNQQYERLFKRDGLNKIEAKQRIEAQWPLEKKLCLADVVIDNSGGFREWEDQINSLF